MKSIILGGAAENFKRGLTHLGGEAKTLTQASVLPASQKTSIPVFFAADDKYLPFLDVAISSVVENASKQFQYKIYVLHSGINGERAEKIMRHSNRNFQIRFVNVEDHLVKIQNFFRLRDYYTPAIYYRLFIVGMFPEYKKAIYLDCDTVALGDVSELYRANLGNNLIGAVADGVVQGVPAFQTYTKEALGISGEEYFNSGVIVMNLDGMRKAGFYEAFCETLRRHCFRVAPDQDCLNVLCKGRVHYFSEAWNRMPQAAVGAGQAKLIHYNLAQKPWHYDGIAYEEYFWRYAKKSPFYQDILQEKRAFTPEMAQRDEEGGAALLALAESEAKRQDNYFRATAAERIACSLACTNTVLVR